MSHGKRNKTCGKRECRKAVFTNVKADTSMYRKQPIISTLPYYGSIATYYNRLLNSKHIQLSEELKELRNFISVTYSEYATIREAYPKTSISIISKDGSKIINTENFKFIASQDEQLTEDLFINQYKYCCRKLMHDLNVSYAVVNSTIKKFIHDYKIDTLITKYGNSLKTILLNKEDYEIVENIIKHNKSRGLSSIVYIVESAGYIKIGITNDITKRLSSLKTATPFEVNLIYSCELGEETAYDIEQYIHTKYEKFNEKLEWFKLSTAQIEDIKNMLENSNEIISKLKAIKIQEEILKLKSLKEKHQNMLEYKLKKYEKQKEEARRANEKPKIETIHEDIEKWDRASQIEACTTHGMSHTDLYKTWQNMKKMYAVCEEWQTFEPFREVVEKEYGQYTKEQAARVYPLVVGVPIGPTNYKVESKYQHKIKSAVAKVVEKLGQNEEVLAEYSSVAEAAKAVDGIASKISAVCRGTRKTHAGFNWRYKE